MNYYKHNIGDYRRDTNHLSLLEHGIFRQMLDQYYLDEKPLNIDKSKLMRSLNIRTSDERESFDLVLTDFFVLTDDGYTHKRCERDLIVIYEKSAKARASAKCRWNKGEDANASETHSSSNANGMLPNTHNPIPTTDNQTKKKGAKKFAPPSLDEIKSYILEKQYDIDGQYFIDFYDSKGWMIGKNKMKDWKATVRGWHSRNKKGNNNGQNRKLTQCEQITENDRVANEWLESQGITQDANGENMERVINPIR
jgi:uncharacterized protein YdaU (DUF1376 family)